jgi:hypothetical protein
MKGYNKLLYMGAGIDLSCAIYYTYIKKFVFIDTQSRSEFDTDKFYPEFYREHFYSNLIHVYNKYGFNLIKESILDSSYSEKLGIDKGANYNHVNPVLLVFYNKDTVQYIHYYISTNIRYNMCPMLEKDIEEVDCLYISGHHPDNELLKYITRPITWICSSDTYFGEQGLDEDTIIYNAYKSGRGGLKQYIKIIYLINGGIIYSNRNKLDGNGVILGEYTDICDLSNHLQKIKEFEFI